MKKTSVLAGWALFFLLLFLSIYSFFVVLGNPSASSVVSYLIYGLSRLLIFGGAVVLLTKIEPYRSRVRLRRRFFSPVYRPFLLFSSLAAALLVFLLYDLTVRPLTGTFRGILDLYPMSGGFQGRFLAVVILLGAVPAVTDEFFLRGVIYSLYERRGTAAAVLMSAIATALLAPSARMLLPLFAAGLFCGFLVHLTGSIYAAVCGNFLIRFVQILMTYAAGGLTVRVWRYIVALLICVFLLLCWLSLRALRKLSQNRLFPRFQTASGTLPQNLIVSMKNPAFLYCFLLVLLRILVAHWLL